MRRITVFLLLAQLSIANYSQIIADHTIVDQYDDIPQQWIDSVKTMWVSTAAASHGEAYRMGCWKLSQIDGRFPSSTQWEGVPESYSRSYLRINTATWGNFSNSSGWQYYNIQEDWWTNATALNRVKAGLQYCHDNGPSLYAIFFGWSFGPTSVNPPGGSPSPVYHTRWAGSTREGPEGDRRWGLTSADEALTGNSVCMDTYIAAQHEYIDYCAANNISTKILWSTGPIDNEQDYAIGESGYQQYLKWQHIRQHVNSLEEAYFIDYADIMSYNDAGEQSTTTWVDNNGTLQTFPIISPENMEGGYIGHIGYNGAVKLAKAMWWLLARMAGWEGESGPDNTPPSKPSEIQLDFVSQNSVSFSWKASTDNVGVSGYNIFRNGIFLETTAEISFTDIAVSPCDEFTYTISAFDAAGNESTLSDALVVNNCSPDLTSTITVSPNVAHGVTIFELIVRVTELNYVNTSGSIIIHIPKDQLWDIVDSFNPTLTILGTTNLDNSDWVYSDDATNHIFTTITSIPGGSFSTFGLRISFNPGGSMGVNPITSQVVSGGGGEIQVTNNSDSERLDYFQD